MAGGGAWLAVVAAVAFTLALLSCASPAAGAKSYSFTVYHQFDPSTEIAFAGRPPGFGAGTCFEFIVVDSENGSHEVGRTHGFSLGESYNGGYVYHGANTVFSAGDYAGSSLHLAGRRDLPQSGTEFDIPVSGGTGVFAYSVGNLAWTLVNKTTGLYKVDATVITFGQDPGDEHARKV